MARYAWKWEKIGKIQKASSCGRPRNLQALSFYYALVEGVGFKRRKRQKKKKTQNTTLKSYGKLPLFIFLTLYQHLGSKGAKFCVL